jgi:hypothetical protein
MIDRKTATLMELFQLMIGNTDYAIQISHNVKFIKLADPAFPKPIAIPYDFDYCGLINAYYAIPAETLPIENVRQRYYFGACREPAEYEEAFQLFFDKRESIESLFRNSEYLTSKCSKGPLSYINEFYKIIESKSNVKSLILNNCR